MDTYLTPEDLQKLDHGVAFFPRISLDADFRHRLGLEPGTDYIIAGVRLAADGEFSEPTVEYVIDVTIAIRKG